MTSREQIELDARKLYAALSDIHLGWEADEDVSEFSSQAATLLDRLRSAYDGPKSAAPSRELACLRMSLDSVGQEIEREDFEGAAVSSIRGDGDEVTAIALAAWGWRAKWLGEIMKLLNTAVDKSIGDLKQSNSDIIAKAAQSFNRQKPQQD